MIPMSICSLPEQEKRSFKMTKEEKIKKIIGFMDCEDYAEEYPEDIERVADVTPDNLEELAALLLDCCGDVENIDDIITIGDYVIWPYKDLSWGFKYSFLHLDLTPAKMYELFPEDCPEFFTPHGRFLGRISAGIVQIVTVDDLNNIR
jgi:hypothetical protein